jgi:hypothetical protein
MYWQDILISRGLTDDEIRPFFSRVFNTPVERISVVSSIEEAPPPENSDILCVRSRAGGDFPLLLSVSLLDTLERSVLWVVGRLCEDLKCSCLVSDDSPSPYRMIKVTGVEQFVIVDLDAELLDELEQYVVVRVRDEIAT